MDEIKVKAAIKRLRKKKGFTHKNMGERLCIGRDTYTKLESGNTRLDYNTLVNISKILDVPVSEITKENGDPVFKSISEEFALALLQTDDWLSRKLCRMISFDDLKPEHKELLKKKGFEGRDAYEDTPLSGRIYQFGPRNVFKFMMENCGMDVFFRRNLILDEYWISRWETYLKEREKITMTFDENGQFIYEDQNEIEIDERDYFIVYIIDLKMPGNKEQMVQFAERDFPEGVDEWGASEYVKDKMGALSAEIMCFTTDGYDPVTEIVK